jgi:hypothetical protein
MSHFLSSRRAGTALVASALTATLAVAGAPAHAVTGSPAGHGAHWLADQLNKKGVIHNAQFDFDDYGLTIDTALALKELGGHATKVAKARQALSRHVDDYTTFADAEFAGSDAKLLVLAQRTGGGARHFGGTNLVSRVNRRVIDSGPSKGRIQDVVDLANAGPDSANVVGQIFAVRGLLKAGRPAGVDAMRFLLRQQCGRGFLRLNFNADPTAADQSCGKGDPADTDVTALAVVELESVAKGHPGLKHALGDAVRWLARNQNANGSLGGSGPTSAANSNSTGLAGSAFLTVGKCRAAHLAAAWVADIQVGGGISGTPLAGERGAIAYDHAAFATATQNGIDRTTRDQWRRAGAQAAPALLALARCRS